VDVYRPELNTVITSSMETTKNEVETREFVEETAPEHLPLPDSIAHLSEESLRHLEKKLVKRLDIFLLPVVALLFLLNILDR